MNSENTAPTEQELHRMDNGPDNDVVEIDLLDLGIRMLDKIHYFIVAFLAGAVLLNAYAYFMVVPTYESTARIYVVSSASDSVVDLSDLNIGTSLTADYEVLVLSYPVLDQVIDEMKLDMDYEDLKEKIQLENPSNTRILNLTVTDSNPKQARDIANKVAEVSIEYLPKTMNTLAPNIAQKAQIPERKSGPSYAKYTILGAVLGVLLCAAWVTISYVMDDTIHTAEDVERYFGVVPFTTIPETDILSADDGDKNGSRKKKKGSKKKGGAR